MKRTADIQTLTMIVACTLVPSIVSSQEPPPLNGQGIAPQVAQEKPSVVATVGGDPITRPEFDSAVQQRVASAQQTATQAGQRLMPQEIAKMEKQTLDVLIESRLVEAYAIENVDVPQSQVQQTIEQMEQQLAQQQVPLET